MKNEKNMLPSDAELKKIIEITQNVGSELEKAIKERAQKQELELALADKIKRLIEALERLLPGDLSGVETEIPGSAAPVSGGANQPGSFQPPG